MQRPKRWLSTFFLKNIYFSFLFPSFYPCRTTDFCLNNISLNIIVRFFTSSKIEYHIRIEKYLDWHQLNSLSVTSSRYNITPLSKLMAFEKWTNHLIALLRNQLHFHSLTYFAFVIYNLPWQVFSVHLLVLIPELHLLLVTESNPGPWNGRKTRHCRITISIIYSLRFWGFVKSNFEIWQWLSQSSSKLPPSLSLSLPPPRPSFRPKLSKHCECVRWASEWARKSGSTL